MGPPGITSECFFARPGPSVAGRVPRGFARGAAQQSGFQSAADAYRNGADPPGAVEEGPVAGLAVQTGQGLGTVTLGHF